MAARMAAVGIALGLAVLGATGSAHANQHLPRRTVTPAPTGSARDGISGNSVVRAGAHGILGGPAAGKPIAISSINRKQHR